MSQQRVETIPGADPDRVLFAEWAPVTAGPAGSDALRERQACPICGHPTGDCTAHTTASSQEGH